VQDVAGFGALLDDDSVEQRFGAVWVWSFEEQTDVVPSKPGVERLHAPELGNFDKVRGKVRAVDQRASPALIVSPSRGCGEISGEQDAFAEQVEAGSDVGLAPDHFDLVDGALDGAGAAGLGEARCNGGEIAPQPGDE